MSTFSTNTISEQTLVRRDLLRQTQFLRIQVLHTPDAF